MSVRRLLAAALLALCLGIAVSPASAPAQGDNAAVAINDDDGSSLFRFAFSLRRVMGDVVDQSNAAVAYSSCESCETLAIAIQVLIVAGDPEVVTPENLALAINEACISCQTLALAYQFVFGGEQVLLSPEARLEVNRIRQDFLALRNAGLSAQEAAVEADELAARLREVVASGLTTAPLGGPSDPPAPAATAPDGAVPGEETGESSTTTGPAAEPPATTEAPPAYVDDGTESTPDESGGGSEGDATPP